MMVCVCPQVFEDTVKGYTLTGEVTCGGGGIMIMNQPIDFIVTTPKSELTFK